MTARERATAVGPSDIDELAQLVTGRKAPLFESDLDRHEATITAAIAGRRILVIGGAGSIGSRVVAEIADRRPTALHVIDLSENNLVELVRSLRGRPNGLDVPDFRTLPLDYGGEATRLFLADQRPYDAVLCFAALKHVRSEKDPWSLLQMLDTNLVKRARFMSWLTRYGHDRRYFAVSTDKAANPVNLMGAGKRVMEHLVLGGDPAFAAVATSTRFANVAFSDGSLLFGFLHRLAKGQPLAVPRDTRRYFVTPGEAGRICLLAAFAAPEKTILVPRLDPAFGSRSLETIARTVLEHRGLTPADYDDEREACRAVEHELERGRYPLLLTPLDTGGEKSFEEFVGDGERTLDAGFAGLEGVRYDPAPPGSVTALIADLEAVVAGRSPFNRERTIEMIGMIIPTFRHINSEWNLDQRL